MKGKGTPMRRRAKPAKSKVRSLKNEGSKVRDLEKRLTEALKREAEALEQQTVTSEILRVIASSPTDLQPVLDAVAESAARLCHAYDVTVFRVEGDVLRLAAHHGPVPATPQLTLPVDRDLVGGRSVLEARTIQVADAQIDDGEFPLAVPFAREFGHRTLLSVPLMREGVPIGVIQLRRTEVAAFTDMQISLLQTFADQAVIAIENVRLFKELEGRNRDLAESLRRETATSEILRVISRSPGDMQPVFDAIVGSAVHLCNGLNSAAYLYDGELIHNVALSDPSTDTREEFARQYPMRPDPEFGLGRVAQSGAMAHSADVLSDPNFRDGARRTARLRGHRALLIVPMLRDGRVIGMISVGRAEPGLFPDSQVQLLQTFADQAVIAIENVRLFTELQTSNRELTTALDTQTATSDILRVISQSQTDVQPVFDAILASAVRLLRAHTGALTRIAGDQIALAGLTSADDAGEAALRARFPQPLHSEDPHAQVIRGRVPINVADAHTDARWPEAARAYARVRGYRSAVVVPLLRHDEALGSIGVNRREPGGFTDDEIALLQTFAGQAVIAIENVRLFKELQARTAELTRSVEKLTALGEVSQALGSTLDVEIVLSTIVSRANQLAGTDACTVYEYDERTEEFVMRATYNLDESVASALRRAAIRRGDGAVGRVAVTREPVHIPDIALEGAYHGVFLDLLLQSGTRALLAVPLLHEDHLVGGLTVNKKTPGEFSPEVVELLKTFAVQSALAIQNARLFREIADKSRQLEAASKHKSEFLANMSHELRTPLNAIIGFSEVLVDRMFGELTEKQDEYLKDIYASGQHLLSLINDILDLSKIEAGRMELEATDFDLPSAIDNALILVRERASRRGITLGHDIDERLGSIRGDERKVKQVLLNLLSNALKFTPEGGRIDVRAAPQDGMAEISVTDTGVGIAPEDQEAVFEEFRQVGTADKKVEGTGLGLALSRKFIELHGGRIWVESEVGKGSTFRFTLPST